MASMSDFGGSVNRLSVLGTEGIAEKRRTSLNLYLLSSVSPMLMLIRSAWSNWLLVGIQLKKKIALSMVGPLTWNTSEYLEKQLCV